VYRSTGNLVHWQAANDGLAGRRLTGLVLSPTFAADRRMVTFGVGEEVLGSHDGGVTWVEADDGLPSLHVAALAVATTRDAEPHLYAALPQGIWMSRRSGGELGTG
jgi:hypothetical protein